MEIAPFLTGQLLLAMPGIGDARFAHAVIAMCAHDEQGALGVGIGRVVPRLGFHELLSQMEIAPGVAPDAPVHVGGPCEPQRGFVLHSREWSGDDSIDVAGLWTMTSTVDVLRAIAAGTGPRRWLAALGYAGWGAGQLEEELSSPGWFAAAADDRLMFDTAAPQRWSRAFAASGIDASLLSASAGHA